MMKELFCIETNLFTLIWERTAPRDPAVLAQRTNVTGRLVLQKRSPQLQFLEGTRRADVPKNLECEPSLEIGPALYEQMNYQIYLKSRMESNEISLHHRDPNLTQNLSSREGNQIVHGTINFRNQIGRTVFTVLVNGKPTLDFELEVFPTKIDYQSDYKEILAQIQEILTSLAYEYLRSTHQMGKLDINRTPSGAEWLVLLEHIIQDLEKSIHYIAAQPRRSLTRQIQQNRIEKVRRIDCFIRSQIRRGAGKGTFVPTTAGPIRDKIMACDSLPTLNTPEHRWIKQQLIDIRRTLSQLLKAERQAPEISERKKTIQETLRRLEQRVSQLLKLEPLVEADGNIPNNFASLQLVSAPGYKEAYLSCMLLKFGLRLEGDLFRMSVKDLDVLYEYWVFLAIVKLLRESRASEINLRDIFKLNQRSLHIRLQEGRRQKVDCIQTDQRRISVIYNCQFQSSETSLIPQKPDVVIRYQEVGWPETLLLCDAKYRIDASEEYRRQFGSYGPPTDSINVLHRYRDAIFESKQTTQGNQDPRHVVVQAVAAFPFVESKPNQFSRSRLWQSIENIGIGAIPALPGNLEYLRKWLVSAFENGGWALADRAIPHVAESRLRDLRLAEAESVVVGTLRRSNPIQHFEWIRSTKIYYVPLSKNQPRQLEAKQIAIYVPKIVNQTSAITHVAEIRGLSIVKRNEINTPWNSEREDDRLMVQYQLSQFRELDIPIKNYAAAKTSILSNRYSTRLAMERARFLNEIALETENEWRLNDSLTIHQIPFHIEAMHPKRINPEQPIGRAWFRLSQNLSIRYDGINGWLIQDRQAEFYLVRLEQVIDYVLQHRSND